MHHASGLPPRAGKGRPAAARYWELARRLGAPARQGRPLRDFLDVAGREILDFTGARDVAIWLRTRGALVRHLTREGSPEAEFSAPWRPPAEGDVDERCLDMLDAPAPAPALVPGEDPHLLLPLDSEPEGPGSAGAIAIGLPPEHLLDLDVPLLEEVIRDLSLAVGSRKANASLRERMKELDCLYRMALIVEEPAMGLEEVLQRILEVLPDAWLHPDRVWLRLELGAATYVAGGEPRRDPRLSADVVTAGKRLGTLSVGYTADMPPMDDGPFLSEERALIRTVAREIALIVERQEIAEESRRLEEQLEHAERLATIGELAAGIGHELNDPLNNVLGYARFIARREDLPEEVRRDADIVVTSAMHARDVIRQLLTFARRMPQQRTDLLVGDVVTDALPLLRALAAKSGTEIRPELAPDLPPVSADAGQLRQVVVNLVANAVHAMPDGGRVTITTAADEDDGVRLVIEDTGSGMPDDVARDAFLPFFTTREGGTGLGLAVVHGIVSAHGGSIQLESELGKGTRFLIRFPAAARQEADAAHG